MRETWVHVLMLQTQNNITKHFLFYSNRFIIISRKCLIFDQPTTVMILSTGTNFSFDFEVEALLMLCVLNLSQSIPALLITVLSQWLTVSLDTALCGLI